MSHVVRMLLGCLLPLALLFVLPLFGVGEGIVLLLFVVLMFACHIFMTHGEHAGHSTHHPKQDRKE